jgi:hypothetical protein
MPRATHRGRGRHQSYVEPAFADRVSRNCVAMGVTESAIVKSALGQYLDGTDDATSSCGACAGECAFGAFAAAYGPRSVTPD